jgi:hypothetical protein
MFHFDNDQRAVDLLATCRSRRIEVSIRILDAGTETAYHPDDWKDSIVEIEAGAVEIETCHGQAVAFNAGDVFWLAGLPVRALNNRGDIPAVLVTATRRRTSITDRPRPPLRPYPHDRSNSTRPNPGGPECLPTTTPTAASLSTTWQ